MADHSTPTYTPTPIHLLQNTSCNSNEHHNESDNLETEYNPAPIGTLYRYEPGNFSSMYSPAPTVWSSSEVPRYSPVESSKSSNFQTNSYELSQSSPKVSPVIKEPKEVFIKPEVPLHAKRRRKSVCEAEDDDDCPSEKRKKILSLYVDLYGEPDEESPTAPPSTIESSVDQFRPEEKIPNIQKNLPQSRPRQPRRLSNKIPMPIRNRYLDQFIEASLRICPSQPEAYALALDEEQGCHDKAPNRLVYLNAVINSLKILKAKPAFVSKQDECHTKKPLSNTTAISKPPPVDFEKILKGPVFYRELKKFLLTEEELVSNGFPRSDSSNGSPRGKAVIQIPDRKKSAMDSHKKNQRICCRCGQIFDVNDFGEAIVKSECGYHWGKPVRRRFPGMGFDLRYTCCQAESGQEGCQIAPRGHVYDTNKWCDLEGYLTTLPPEFPSSDSATPVNVYALDCEMVYTTGGCELARVTVVNANLEVVMDKIVRPLNPIVDANTRFSGLSIETLEASPLQIMDVQMELLQLWDENTILIGHSLESDLTALKFIHSKVVDTSVVFPHSRGPPFKRALRTIVGDQLELLIQNDGRQFICNL